MYVLLKDLFRKFRNIALEKFIKIKTLSVPYKKLELLHRFPSICIIFISPIVRKYFYAYRLSYYKNT